jgi:hypothetical protein
MMRCLTTSIALVIMLTGCAPKTLRDVTSMPQGPVVIRHVFMGGSDDLYHFTVGSPDSRAYPTALEVIAPDSTMVARSRIHTGIDEICDEQVHWGARFKFTEEQYQKSLGPTFGIYQIILKYGDTWYLATLEPGSCMSMVKLEGNRPANTPLELALLARHTVCGAHRAPGCGRSSAASR